MRAMWSLEKLTSLRIPCVGRKGRVPPNGDEEPAARKRTGSGVREGSFAGADAAVPPTHVVPRRRCGATQPCGAHYSSAGPRI
jgi:hypothetical protein